MKATALAPRSARTYILAICHCLALDPSITLCWVYDRRSSRFLLLLLLIIISIIISISIITLRILDSLRAACCRVDEVISGLQVKIPPSFFAGQARTFSSYSDSKINDASISVLSSSSNISISSRRSSSSNSESACRPPAVSVATSSLQVPDGGEENLVALLCLC